MRKMKPSSEDKMVYEFLKMELDSDRHREKIEDALAELGVDKIIITCGNIMSEQENALRVKTLRQFRGYNDKELFENYPANIEWIWVELENSDFSKIKYMNYSYWNELSNQTGSPQEAAKTILSGKTIYDVPNSGAINGAKRLKEGHKFPPLILLTDQSEKRYFILEGHGRMAAYGLVPEMFHRVSALLGYCDYEELGKWYGKDAG